MQTSDDFIRALCERYPEQTTTSYRLAKLLGVTNQYLYQRGKNGKPGVFSDETGERIAELLDLPLEYVLSCLDAERAKRPTIKAARERMAHLFEHAKDKGKKAARVAMLLLGLMVLVPQGNIVPSAEASTTVGGLENRWPARARGFESLPLRQSRRRRRLSQWLQLLARWLLPGLAALALAGCTTPTTPPVWIAAGQSNMTTDRAIAVPTQFAFWRRTAGRAVEVVPVAIGGTALACWQVGAECFNRRTAALRGTPIEGVIWWQGESDALDCTGAAAAVYGAELRRLIEEWRATFGAELPFYLVELPTYVAVTDLPPCADGAALWAQIRAAQARVAAEVPRVTLIRSTDITFGDDIHPVYAYNEIARRLAAATLTPPV